MNNIDINQSIETANKMWLAYKKKSDDKEWMKKDPQDKIGYFQSIGFSDFITKFSIPAKYMVMYEEYSRKAFYKYLVRLKTIGYHSKDDWIDRQADYIKFLWRAYNPKGNSSEGILIWQESKNKIKKEMEDFEGDYKKAEHKAEQRAAAAIESNRKALLMEFYKNPEKFMEVKKELEPEVVEQETEQSLTQKRNALRRKKEKTKKSMAAMSPIKEENRKDDEGDEYDELF